MNSSIRLDSAVFQLTPTRTRCDLFIIANGKKEKIASGLLNPFLSHLKAAQDQMAKGGYSIILEPENVTDPSWFTRGTLERFVRFVSTPEILERVNTIELEILQIEEAIAIQSNNSVGMNNVEESEAKLVEKNEGIKPSMEGNEEKAIVLYKPDTYPREVNETAASGGNTKVQLLKVLETRKSMLQKEQGMAFARAVAAGFDIDCMPQLISFAECFGAFRLLNACKKFMELWSQKHESGQWVEIDAADAMSSRLDFSPTNMSSIVLSTAVTKSPNELQMDTNRKTTNGDMPMTKQQPSISHQDHVQGQFPHMFSPWPMHSPPGTVPVYPSYPIQGMPYYRNYPGNIPFYQPYPPVDDPRFMAGQRKGHRRTSMDGGDNSIESEILDVDAKSRSHYENYMDDEGSRARRKKGSHSAKQKGGTVVIRNINYITAKKENSSESESKSDPASDIDENNDFPAKSSKRRGQGKEPVSISNTSDKEGIADSGHWLAFQNCLLRDADEDRHSFDPGQIETKGTQRKTKPAASVHDPLVSNGRDIYETQEVDVDDRHRFSHGRTCVPRSSTDALLVSRIDGPVNCQNDLESSEIDARSNGYRRPANYDFMVHKQDHQSADTRLSTGLLAVGGLDYSDKNFERKSLQDSNDDSYIVPYRSTELNGTGNNRRNAIDVDSELPLVNQKGGKSSNMTRNQVNYRPDELNLMPERGNEISSPGYDPAFDYEMQLQAEAGASLVRNKNSAEISSKQGLKKSDRDLNSKSASNGLAKNKIGGPIRRGKPSKLSPLDEARSRAEKMRNYKADLQKMKKEKEEEEMKRIQALKIERQKRIAVRGSSIPAQSPVTSQLRKQLLPKLSPSSHKASKFSDSETGSSSPLHRVPIRAASLGSNDSKKLTKPGRLSVGNHKSMSRLTHSVQSLPDSKSDKSAADNKALMARTRRLSEPKAVGTQHVPAVKPRSAQSAETKSKTRASNGPESKKISEIVSLDKSKGDALPELKIKTSNRPDIQSKSAASEKSHKLNGDKSSQTSQGSHIKKNEGIPPTDNADDNPVIEKTVMMLEVEKSSIPAVQEPDDNLGKGVKLNDTIDGEERAVVIPDYNEPRVPVSPQTKNKDVPKILESRSRQLSKYCEATTGDVDQNSPSSKKSTEESYQAPYARVSSLEEPFIGDSEYGQPTPITLETVETVRALVTDSRNSKLEKILEAADKPLGKESSKGFKRLLKFGRKNQNSTAADQSMESDNISMTGSEAGDCLTTTTSSSEVHTLKNLISKDERPSSSTNPEKASPSFSLLSPFRSKTSDKKLTT